MVLLESSDAMGGVVEDWLEGTRIVWGIQQGQTSKIGHTNCNLDHVRDLFHWGPGVVRLTPYLVVDR